MERKELTFENPPEIIVLYNTEHLMVLQQQILDLEQKIAEQKLDPNGKIKPEDVEKWKNDLKEKDMTLKDSVNDYKTPNTCPKGSEFTGKVFINFSKQSDAEKTLEKFREHNLGVKIISLLCCKNKHELMWCKKPQQPDDML